ncbi:hypothetical protein ACFP3I_10880 [Chryseobacterium arachidis]|uniref:hypothetical protein n=1 Tax=Chryseobacterium arachidis TaxID=1416778 RepID=UPI0036163030
MDREWVMKPKILDTNSFRILLELTIYKKIKYVFSPTSIRVIFETKWKKLYREWIMKQKILDTNSFRILLELTIYKKVTVFNTNLLSQSEILSTKEAIFNLF